MFGPKVDEVGRLVRVGGGWIAPVRFTSGECALLRCYLGDGFVSETHVCERKSDSGNVQVLLRNSTRLPEVFEGPDPGLLYLRVADIENEGTFDEIETVYELRLAGILGHIGDGTSDVVATASASWS